MLLFPTFLNISWAYVQLWFLHRVLFLSLINLSCWTFALLVQRLFLKNLNNQSKILLWFKKLKCSLSLGTVFHRLYLLKLVKGRRTFQVCLLLKVFGIIWWRLGHNSDNFFELKDMLLLISTVHYQNFLSHHYFQFL